MRRSPRRASLGSLPGLQRPSPPHPPSTTTRVAGTARQRVKQLRMQTITARRPDNGSPRSPRASLSPVRQPWLRTPRRPR